MAIEQFGKSLLADVRKRKDDQARAMAKQEEKNAWAALGANVLIKGAESYMKENTKDFLYNQNIYTARQQQQRALNHQKNLYKTQNEIESQGISDEMYFEKLIRPELEAQLALQVEGYKPGEVTKYDQLIANQARELAKERAAQYREAITMANNVETSEDFNLRLASAAKRAAPSTLGDWVGSKVTGLFTGRSSEEMEDEAALAIAEGPLAQNNKALNLFMTKYNETKDAGRAFDFTKMVLPEVDPEDSKTVEERIELKGSGKTWYAVKIQKKKDEFTGDITEQQVGEVKRVSASDPESAGEDLLAALKSDFNFAKDARDQMTVDSFAAFANRVEKEVGTPLSTISTLSDYTKVAQIYGEFINNNPDALNDTFRNDIYKSTMDLFVSEAIDLQAMLAGFEDDPQKRQAMMEELMKRVNTLAMYARGIAGRTDYNDM